MILKDESVFYKIWCLLIAQFVYFLWMPYPKSFWNKSHPIPDAISNTVFFAIFFFLLIRLLPCYKGHSQKGKYISRKEIAAKIIILFLVQLILDGARFFSLWMPSLCSLVYNDILTIAAWILFYKIIAKKSIALEFSKHRKVFLFCAAAIVLAFLLVTFENYIDAKTLASLNDKHALSTVQMEDHRINAVFSSQLRNMFLDSVAGMAVLVCSSDIKESLHFSNKNMLETGIARCISFLVIVLFFGGMKLLLLPYSAIGGFKIASSGCYSYRDNEDSYLSTTFSLYRMCSYAPSDIEICCVWTGTGRW